MNIAFVHSIFPSGGAERVTYDIARYLHGKDYRTYIFTSKVNKRLYTDEMKRVATLVKIPCTKAKSVAIEEFVRLFKIDILVQVAAPVARIKEIREHTGVKVVYANHGQPFWQSHSIIAHRQNIFFKKILWKLYWHKIYSDSQGGKARRMAIDRSRKIYDECDVYTVLCEAYKQQTCAVFGIDPAESHITAIENSEPVREVVHYDKEKIILFCGRLQNYCKRVDLLLNIWSLVQHRLEDWKLLVVGDGPDTKEIKRLARKLCLERVFFEGEHHDVQTYYDRASVLALTSETEGWGLCLTEAQASGVIPIAFACSSGVEEVLKPDGVNGFLVQCFDQQAYADKLVEIAQMSEEKQLEMRRAMVRHRAAYAPDAISSKWKALFDKMMEKQFI